MPQDIYIRMAEVYDPIYMAMKDYQAEAKRVRDLINQYARIEVTSLLDVCCGTGLHGQFLQKWFKLAGLDSSPSMLAIARKRLPGVSLLEADMANFSSGTWYDAATCLFSAIAHLDTVDQLHRGIACMESAVKPGGVLLVEPYIGPADFRPGNVSVNAGETDELKVVRVVRSERDGHIARCQMHHFVTRGSIHEEPFTVPVDLAMYTVGEITDAFHAADLEVVYDDHGLMGRGLFIGRKPM